MASKHPILASVDNLLLKAGETANGVLSHIQKLQKAFPNQSGEVAKDRWTAVSDQLGAIATLLAAVREEAKAAAQLDIEALRTLKENKDVRA